MLQEAGGAVGMPDAFVVNLLSLSWLRSRIVQLGKSHPFKRQQKCHHYDVLVKQNIFVCCKGLIRVQPCFPLRMSERLC